LPSPLKTAAAAASSDDNEGEEAEDGDGGGGGGGGRAAAKPKPFLTRRMRRGPIGAAASISSNNKAAAAAAKADGDDADAKPPAAPAPAKGAHVTPSPAVLKVSKKWACIANCGACCYLAPSERPFLMEYFDEDPDDLAQYNSMVGDDGWCIHYDKTARACTVFEDRPWFCRVEGETFERMYGVTAPEMDKFCTSCCREQIGDVYGVGSTEMTAFNTAIKHLRAAADGKDGGGAAGGGGGGKKKGGGFGKAAKESAAENARMAGIEIKPIDPFTGEVSDKAAAKADWI
jgi:Fe-S-cluster containining protein